MDDFYFVFSFCKLDKICGSPYAVKNHIPVFSITLHPAD